MWQELCLSILQCTGQPCRTQNYLDQNVSIADDETILLQNVVQNLAASV